MNVYFFAPLWGNKHLNPEIFAQKCALAGYHGIEWNLSDDTVRNHAYLTAFKKYGLKHIIQQSKVTGQTPKDYGKALEHYLEKAIALNPICINSHTGHDAYTFKEHCTIIECCIRVAARTSVPIYHEIHRGRFTYTPYTIPNYLRKFPKLQFTTDLSHWTAVTESMLQHPRQKKIVETVLCYHTGHLHARVGTTQSPQITDLHAPEYTGYIQQFMLWWMQALEAKLMQSAPFVTITPEFGPEPYLIRNPATGLPICDIWEQNIAMKSRISNAWKEHQQHILNEIKN